MRRYLSCWMLQIRSVLGQLLAAFAAMTALECLLFYRALSVSAERSFDALVSAAHTGTVAYGGYLACWIILSLSLYGKNSRYGYTLRRLLISEREFYLLQCLTNLSALFALWGAQALCVLILLRMYIASGVLIGPQAILLAVYRSEFLGAVFPMQRVSLWVMDLSFCVSIGVFLADSAVRIAQGKNRVSFLALFALGFVRLPYDASWGFRLFLSVLMLVLACFTLAAERGSTHPGVDEPGDPDEPREPYRPQWEVEAHEGA